MVIKGHGLMSINAHHDPFCPGTQLPWSGSRCSSWRWLLLSLGGWLALIKRFELPAMMMMLISTDECKLVTHSLSFFLYLTNHLIARTAEWIFFLRLHPNGYSYDIIIIVFTQTHTYNNNGWWQTLAVEKACFDFVFDYKIHLSILHTHSHSQSHTARASLGWRVSLIKIHFRQFVPDSRLQLLFRSFLLSGGDGCVSGK